MPVGHFKPELGNDWRGRSYSVVTVTWIRLGGHRDVDKTAAKRDSRLEQQQKGAELERAGKVTCTMMAMTFGTASVVHWFALSLWPFATVRPKQGWRLEGAGPLPRPSLLHPTPSCVPSQVLPGPGVITTPAQSSDQCTTDAVPPVRVEAPNAGGRAGGHGGPGVQGGWMGDGGRGGAGQLVVQVARGQEM